MFLIVQYLCKYFQAPNSLAVAKLSTKFVSRRVQFPESFDKLSATSNKQTNQKVQKLQRFLKLSSSGRPRTLVAAGHGIPHVVRVEPILGKARSSNHEEIVQEMTVPMKERKETWNHD